MTSLVVDASVAAAWLLPTQRTAASDALRQQASSFDLEAPAILNAEVRNVLLMAERRGKLTPNQVTALLAIFAGFRINVSSPPDTDGHERVLDLARGEGLTMYDAYYLHQAVTRGSALASRDAELLDAAKRTGIMLFDLR
jgi:predicted nucleic acid-binding protein